MNTIKRPRRRPRVHSLNFRTFFWLLAREAAYQVYRAWWEQAGAYLHTRRDNLTALGPRWRTRAATLARLYPRYRVQP